MMNLDWHHGGIDAGADVAPSDGCCAPAWTALRPACFDLRQVCQVLAPLCPQGQVPRSAQLLNVWFTPPARLLLVYRLDPVAGETVTVTVAVDDRPEATAPDLDAAGAGPAGVWIAPWRARAWRLPDDPGQLPLARLMDPRTSIDQLAANGFAGWTPVADRRPDLLSYLPGHRTALRWRGGAGQDDVVLKCQSGAARSHAAMQDLWRSPARRFGMAEPLALDAEAQVRWERFVPGVRLEVAAARDGWETTLRRMLPDLVALHGSCLPRLPNQSRAQVLARLQGKVSRRVQAALPRHAEALARQCGQLARWSGEPAVVQAVLHGDLHTGNLLVTPAGHTVFIDLDSLTTGEPAYDLALLSTRLVLQALLNQAEPAQVDVLVARLPDWYEEAGGDPRAAAAYPWHVAALLTARQLKTCIRHAAPQLPHLAQALMALAGRVIDTGAVPHDLLGAAAGPDRRIGQAVQRSVVT